MSELRRRRPVRRPPRAARRRRRCAPFNEAGVLAAADVHVAARLAGAGRRGRPDVALAAALAVRAPRLGHVYVDLATVRDTTVGRRRGAGRPRRAPVAGGRRAGAARLAASALVAGGPLRLEGTRVYLDRYWREERQIAADLRAFGGDAGDGARGRSREDVLARRARAAVRRRTTSASARAAEAAVRRRLAVVAGGPGTGKTTTVARIAALLAEQAAAAGVPAPLIALAAPTGKAAARLEEAVHDEARAARRRPRPCAPRCSALRGLDAAPAARPPPRQPQPLPPPPRQPAPARRGRRRRDLDGVAVADGAARRGRAAGGAARARRRPGPAVLDRGGRGARRHRRRRRPATGSWCSTACTASAAGSRRWPARCATATPTAALDGAARGARGRDWIEADAGGRRRRSSLVRARAPSPPAARSSTPPRDGDAEARAGRARRLPAAVRAPPRPVRRRAPGARRSRAGWPPTSRGFCADERWYAGRPLLVTENDYGLRLYNGDTGVVVARRGRARRPPRSSAAARSCDVSPSRLERGRDRATR